MRFLSNVILPFLILFVQYELVAQNKASCCQMSSVQLFADLAKDISFAIIHENPLPFTLKDPSGKNIKFKVSNGEDGQAYYIAGSEKSNQWIFVFHEWWGLNDYIKNEAEKLHTDFPSAHILAIDLYDGKVAMTREDAGSFMQSAKPERLEAIIKGASEFSGKNSKIATIGWCFGGAWSHKSSIILGNKSNACVIYYGMPVIDPKQLSNSQAPVLGLFADLDGWITPKVVDDFKKLMIENGKSIEVHSYNAVHAFANPSNAKYNNSDAEDAWVKTLTFLKKHIQ